MLKNHLNKLENTLNHYIQKFSDKKIAVPFSGGLDSSVIALIASKYAKPILYVAGLSNSYDLENAPYFASLLNLPIIEIQLREEDVENAIPVVIDIIDSKNPVHISFELPLFFVSKNSAQKMLMGAQGADELFAGYFRYLRLKPNDLERTLSNDVKKLMGKEIEMDKKIVSHFGKTLYTPFLDEKFVETALKIPVDYKIRNNIRKYILRELGKSIGLPGEIVEKEKKAAQYSSGAMKAMKRLAKENRQTLRDYIKDVCME